MAISFLTSTEVEVDVYLTMDDSIELTEEQRSQYLSKGVFEGKVNEGATVFTLKALSPSDREEAEVRAGSYTRSELGRMLWIESPSDDKEKATWHHSLDDEEKEALGSYQAYLNRVYIEMIRSSLVSIDGEKASVDQVQMIRPESHRIQAITELVLHIQRLSLVGGRAWNCEQCKNKKGLRSLRGNCGGPFRDGLPLSDSDELGRFIPGYRVAPNCGEGYSDLKIRSCPIADMNRLAPIITAYHRHRKGILPLNQSFKSASCAIVEAYDILDSNTEEMIRRSQEQKMKEFNDGRN